MNVPDTTVTAPTSRVSLPPLSILGQPPSKLPRSRQISQKPASMPGHNGIILVGLDERGKAHASRFNLNDVLAAHAAATEMLMHAVEIVDDALIAIAAKLPKGKLFESGRAFVPFVRRDTFDQLMAYVSDEAKEAVEAAKLVAAASKSEAEPAKGETDSDGRVTMPPILPNDLPADWSKIRVGSIVLASDSREDGWWEATVNEARDDVFVLSWRGFPSWEPFERKGDQLALLPSGYAGR